MGRDIPSPAASEHEKVVEIGAPSTDDEAMSSVSPVPLDDEHVSPELALVDPDLAGRLSSALPELEPSPPREVEPLPHIRLAPSSVDEPEAGPEEVTLDEEGTLDEHVVVEEPTVVDDAVDVREPEPGAVEDDMAAEAPPAVGEPETGQQWHVVAASPVREVPEVVEEPGPEDAKSVPEDAAPVAALPEPEPGGASLRVEPRPVDRREPAATATWPPVPPPTRPRRFRIRRVLLTFSIGALLAALVVVGVIYAISVLGDTDSALPTVVRPLLASVPAAKAVVQAALLVP
jgi:hypothetical protein